MRREEWCGGEGEWGVCVRWSVWRERGAVGGGGGERGGGGEGTWAGVRGDVWRG